MRRIEGLACLAIAAVIAACGDNRSARPDGGNMTPDGGVDAPGDSTSAVCSNGMKEAGEDCDGTDLGSPAATCESALGAGATGTVSCTSSCTIDSSACQLCGDGIIQGSEECDGTNVGTATCSSVPGGFLSGSLGCATCMYDTTDCSTAAPASTAGQIVISEVMQNPAQFLDVDGEWFEIHNPGTSALNLRGCVFSGTGGATDTFTVTTNLIVAAGGYLTFAPVTAVTGAPGFTPSYTYTGGTGGFQIANGSDGITLTCGTTVIDSIAYDDGATFPDPTGVSMTLDPRFLNMTDNDTGANWCLALSRAGTTTDLGTPNAANDPCQTFPIGFCRLQFPLTIAGTGGELVTTYGRVGITGLTDRTGMTDPYPRLFAQVGFGPDGTDPVTSAAWVWTAATANTAYGPTSPAYEAANDEYQGTLTVPQTSGSYDFAFRFSGDTGTTWTVCDTGAGSMDGYAAADAGQMTVTAPAPVLVSISPATIDIATSGTGILYVVLDRVAPVGGFAVALSSSDAAVTTPASITVPAGQSRAGFRVRGGASAGTATISATAGVTVTATVNVVTTVPAPVANDLLINEVLADPFGGVATDVAGDANCNGTRSTTGDEYVELVNASTHPVELLSVSLWDATNFATGTGTVPRFTFPSFVLGPGEAVLVFGETGGTTTTQPWCTGASASGGAGQPFRIGDAVAFAPPPVGDLGLNNAGDTVTVTTGVLASTTVIVSLAYLSTSDQSWTRSPDLTGALAGYLSAPGHLTDRSFSPGTFLTGRPFAEVSAP